MISHQYLKVNLKFIKLIYISRDSILTEHYLSNKNLLNKVFQVLVKQIKNSFI